MNKVVEVKNLEKSYKKNKAVDGISFKVNQGEILGLLGPNGAGKSTTINILAGILSSDHGEVSILGRDLKKDEKIIKQAIGIVPQDLAIYEDITAKKNVQFFASLYKLKGKQLEAQVKQALELVGLYDRRDDKPKNFSGGMKRRLNIACAIAHQPKLIIMDEPTVGIDPQSRNHILRAIETLKRNGAAVIYSTHYMEEVEAISDRIVVMNDGKIAAEGTTKELKQTFNNQITYYFRLKNVDHLSTDQFYKIAGVKEVSLIKNSVEIVVEKSSDQLNDIMSVMITNGYVVESMSSKEVSLETVFLELTGRRLRD